MKLAKDFSDVPVHDFSLVTLTSRAASLITAVSRSLAQLEDEVQKLGLLLPEGNYGKQELLDILSKAFWERKHPGIRMPTFEKPMLIQSLKDRSLEEQQKIWESPQWAAEQKRNGIRCIAYLGSPSFFHSRNISVTDYLPEGLNSQLRSWLDPQLSQYSGTVVDGEIISVKKEIDTSPFTKAKGTVTNNVLQAVLSLLMVERSQEAQAANGWPLRYVLYDILKYKGKDIKNLPYSQRREFLTEVAIAWQQKLRDPNFLILNASVTVDKRNFYEDCINRGEEGCVVKALSGIYKGGQTRTRDQLKVKREVEVDAVVIEVLPPNSGRFVQEGLLGGLVFASKDINTGKWYRVAAVSNVDLEFRRIWSIQDENGNFTGVKPGIIGTVWEIQGHDWTKNVQLAHARIIRSRNEGPDAKSVDEATFDLQGVMREIVSREGGAGQAPSPVEVSPPLTVENGNAPVEVSEVAPGVREVSRQLRPRLGKEKVWVHDGEEEIVTLIRKGDKNSRIEIADGRRVVVPSSQLS